MKINVDIELDLVKFIKLSGKIYIDRLIDRWIKGRCLINKYLDR